MDAQLFSLTNYQHTPTNTCDQDIVFMMVQLIVRGLLSGPHPRIYSVLFIIIYFHLS